MGDAHRTGRSSRQAGITMMEFLIAAVIGVIISGVLIMMWINIGRSSAMTVSHAEARDFARSGIARLSREVRDAEALPGYVAVLEAGPTSIVVTTTFNRSGADVETTKPRVVRYWYDPTLPADQRRLYRDLYPDGVTDDWASYAYERRDVIIPHLLNVESTPAFTYTYIDGDGDRMPGTDDPPVLTVTDPDDRARILLVSIHVLVDLDPDRAPNPMEISTQAQLRNQRVLY